MNRKLLIVLIVIGIVVSIVSTLLLQQIIKNIPLTTKTITTTITPTTVTSTTNLTISTTYNCISQDNVFIVIYRNAKPLDIAYKSLSQIISEVLKSNSSGQFDVEFTLCYTDLEELPQDLQSLLKKQFNFYPIFALRSKNMSRVKIPITNVIFDKYENSIYISKPNITWYLYFYFAHNYGFQYLNISGVYATITVIEKPKTHMNATPIIGSENARYYIYIYEDVNCPYCAKLYHEVLPIISNLIDNGTIAILLKNFLVHEESLDVQRYIVALYIATHDSNLVYDTMKFIYDSLLNGSTVSLDQVKEFVLNKYGKDVNVENYLKLAEDIINQEREEAIQYIIVGTPGIIIWDNRNGIGIVVTGFKPAEDMIKLLNFLNKT